MDDSVTKPVTLAEICAKLDRWLPLDNARNDEVRDPGPSRRPQMPSAEGLLDHALLTEIAGGDPQAYAQVLADLRRNNDADSCALRAAVAAADFAEAVQLAHRLRGACAMLGALQLADASAEVQSAAGDRDRGRLASAMEKLEKEMLRLNKHLDSLD